MSFNIIEASKNISNKYQRYLKTMFDIKDEDYKKTFNKRLEESKAFEKGPYLDVTNSFAKGRNLEQLIQAGVISSDFRKIKRLYNIPNLHYHQEQALLKAIKGENLIVSTGTGSGKTESFLLPVINELMREKENGTLTSGVRALIIYPMNALANDQIDRLRKTFIEYPEITFGCYTGQTRNHEKTSSKEKGAIDQYLELNSKRTDDVRLQKPLKNERLSRDSMKEDPPHILITNYAMLEYLMLRPEDNVFFDGPTSKYWKYIILDEAHTYKGSTGIEVSMLLRRLMAQLNNPNLQFILTSATLGDEDSNKDVVSFAENLCSVKFKEENIIRAKRIEISQDNIKYKLDNKFYEFVEKLIDYGYDDNYIINEIENKFKFNINNSNLSEYLYDILVCDATFWKIKKFLSKPKSIREIRDYTGLSENEISTFVEVASRASKNGSKLFDSRYHMFLRATEGVFITLAPHKDLFLTRKNSIHVNDSDYKVFEAVTCTQCHSLYLLGYIDSNSYLVQKSTVDSDQIKEAFYLGNQINDSDEDDTLSNSDLAVEKYQLCPHCGFIRSESENIKRSCGHDESHFVNVVKVKTTNKNDGRVTKCICCENTNRLGILRGFFTGQESSTSVIATALFEELPSHIRKITTVNNDEIDDGFDINQDESIEEVTKAKQFIAFSDSRQAAAYFSSYFSVSYDEILYGRMIVDELSKIKHNQIEVTNFVDNLSSMMKENNVIPFDEYLHSLKTNSVFSFDYEKIGWQAILKEFVDCFQRTSLIGLGLLGINFNDQIKFAPHKKYGLTANEVRDICMVFVMGMLADAAIYYPKGLNDYDKEYFTHNGIELSYLRDSGDKYVKSFIPQNDSFSNKRLDYLGRVLAVNEKNITREDIKKVLGQIWDCFFANNKPNNPQIMFKDMKAHYKVNIENLVLAKNKKWYCCSKCNKITSFNVKNVCPTYKCDGKLEEVNVDELEKNNHYYRMYHDLEIQPMRVVEHTAQLNREEAYNYQTLFKEQKIDVLSCSTTFEMGVDVGDLETVFMRNMPPSASNYAQRAGRAGRSSTAAAFALTFCNKSNHDFNYFEKPTEMICGAILPPHFKTDNEKICIRHLYSSAFSYFFKLYPTYFSNAKNMLEKNEDTGLSGYELLESFLKKDSKEREDLKRYLISSIPASLHPKFKINSFGWVDWLFDKNYNDYPNLKNVREIYLNEINILRSEYDKAKLAGDPSQYSFKNRISTYEKEPIISFLSKNNILPKYGFPVDTVELELNAKSKSDDISGLELSRDLSMAISEYAPGCQVVANNKLVTSRYIKKNPGFDWRKYDYVECSKCKTLNVSPNTFIEVDKPHQLSCCKQCGNEIDIKNIKTFLIPEFGFIAEEKIGKPSLIKPEKTFRTEATFYNYNEQTNENEYEIGNTNVSIAFVGNDGEMAMLNTTDFFVCPYCGYAKEVPEGINPFQKKLKENHKDPNGYNCKKNVELERYSLGYKFKTDVVRIRIDQPLLSTNEQKYEEAYSILQALILSSCKELNIENTEIAGCLQYYYNNGDNYSYILYDKTPGGAGHVKRLNNKDVILHVLINAMNLAQKCPNCDEDSSCYSCLRTYQNQKNHDIIKRKYVFNYLGQVLNGVNDEDSDSKLEDIFLSKLQTIADTWNVTGKDKNIYEATFNNQKWSIEPQVYLDPTKNVIKPSKPDFLLTPMNTKQKKIAVFTDGFKYHNDIIDNDTIKRDAIIFSGNYRVWNLSWNDVKETSDKIFATEVFTSEVLPSKLDITKYEINYKNSFKMLIEYLKNENAESDFKVIANSYFKAMIGRNEDKNIIHYDLAQINDQISFYNPQKISNIDKYIPSADSFLKVYLIDDGRKNVVSYIQDYISKRNNNFIYDWNGFIQLNNIMQFVDNFITVSQQGLDNDLYSILANVEKTDGNISNEWNNILNQIYDNETKKFVKECISKNIILPSVVGYELEDGSVAELEWDSLDIVYLTTEQMEFKNNFEEKGFYVISSMSELENIIK